MPPFVTSDQLRRALATDAARKPDIVKATYVGPDGARGKHIVKLNCSEREIAVSGPPHQTFKPGTSVLLASHQNGQHRTMLAYPVGARGASQYQAATQHRQAEMGAGFGPTACPISITGKTYLGVYHDGADLLLWNYNDGTYASDVASITTAYVPVNQSVCKVPSSTKIAYIGDFGGDLYVCAWDYVGNTFDTWNTAGSPVVGVSATSSYLYAMVGQLYRLGLDCSSPTTVGDSATAFWIASDSALYAHVDDSTLGAHDGATPADPWTTEARTLIGSSGDSANFRAGSATSGLDTLVRYNAIGAVTGGSVTTLNVNTGAEAALWPAHWVIAGYGNRALLGVGNDDVTLYDGSTYARLALTNYTAVEATCAWPGIAVDAHPTVLAAPGAFIPLD